MVIVVAWLSGGSRGHVVKQATACQKLFLARCPAQKPGTVLHPHDARRPKWVDLYPAGGTMPRRKLGPGGHPAFVDAVGLASQGLPS